MKNHNTTPVRNIVVGDKLQHHMISNLIPSHDPGSAHGKYDLI